MKTKVLTIAVLLAASMAMAPAVMAGHAADESDESVWQYYLLVEDEGVSVWEETNDHGGLQTTETTYEVSSASECLDGETFETQDQSTPEGYCVVDPDDQVAP